MTERLWRRKKGRTERIVLHRKKHVHWVTHREMQGGKAWK